MIATFFYHLLHESEFWVFVSFLIFLGVLYALGAHRKLLVALEARRQRIAQALTQAQKMRADAQLLLAQYQRRRQQVNDEIENILEEAREKARRQQAHMEAYLAESVQRMEKITLDHIARLEQQAVDRMMRDVVQKALVMVETQIKAEAVHPAIYTRALNATQQKWKEK